MVKDVLYNHHRIIHHHTHCKGKGGEGYEVYGASRHIQVNESGYKGYGYSKGYNEGCTQIPEYEECGENHDYDCQEQIPGEVLYGKLYLPGEVDGIIDLYVILIRQFVELLLHTIRNGNDVGAGFFKDTDDHPLLSIHHTVVCPLCISIFHVGYITESEDNAHPCGNRYILHLPGILNLPLNSNHIVDIAELYVP